MSCWVLTYALATCKIARRGVSFKYVEVRCEDRQAKVNRQTKIIKLTFALSIHYSLRKV